MSRASHVASVGVDSKCYRSFRLRSAETCALRTTAFLPFSSDPRQHPTVAVVSDDFGSACLRAARRGGDDTKDAKPLTPLHGYTHTAPRERDQANPRAYPHPIPPFTTAKTDVRPAVSTTPKARTAAAGRQPQPLRDFRLDENTTLTNSTKW